MLTASDTCTPSNNYSPACHTCTKSSWFVTVLCFRQGKARTPPSILVAISPPQTVRQLLEHQAGLSRNVGSPLSTTVFLFSLKLDWVDCFEYAQGLCAKCLTQDFELRVQKECWLQSSWWYHIRYRSCLCCLIDCLGFHRFDFNRL